MASVAGRDRALTRSIRNVRCQARFRCPRRNTRPRGEDRHQLVDILVAAGLDAAVEQGFDFGVGASHPMSLLRTPDANGCAVRRSRHGLRHRGGRDLGLPSAHHSRLVLEGGRLLLFGAMGTAVDDLILLDAMSYDPASAMRTGRCELLDGAFETVECVGLTVRNELERLVVVISALIASSHGEVLPRGRTGKGTRSSSAKWDWPAGKQVPAASSSATVQQRHHHGARPTS
ncbi:hypothetical protein FG93_05044 [Bosea sp. LC85]|nr:hypothetical protein FG93_05044 [Bosea sp. LC85]